MAGVRPLRQPREQRRAALAELNSQLTEIRGSAVGMAGAFAAGAFATGHLISLADGWSSANACLKQAAAVYLMRIFVTHRKC